MRIFRSAAIALSLLSLGACVHLDEVREFAGESAQLSGYTGVVEHTLGAYARAEPYLVEDVRIAEKIASDQRQASRDTLISLHKVASAYMTTLAKLAGEGSFNTDTGIDKVAKSITAAPELGVSSATVNAYATLVHKIAGWASEVAQETAVRKMIVDGKDDIESVLGGLADVARILDKIHQNEKRSVLDGLETMIATTPATPNNYLIIALARDQLNQKRVEYAKADAIFAKSAKGIADVREGFATLAKNIDRLDAKDVRDHLVQLRTDIKNIRNALSSAGI